MNETQCIAKFKKRLPGWLFYKLHGGMFQASLPDVIVIDDDGDVTFMEFKIVDGLSLPWSKCRLNQHLTMLEMRRKKASVCYIVYSRKTEKFYELNPMEVIEGKTTKLEDDHEFSF